MARTASLIAVAVLPAAAGSTGAACLDAGRFEAASQRAAIICAVACVPAGAASAVTIRNGAIRTDPAPDPAAARRAGRPAARIFVPAVSVPAVSVPAVSVPAVSVPAVSVPAVSTAHVSTAHVSTAHVSTAHVSTALRAGRAELRPS